MRWDEALCSARSIPFDARDVEREECGSAVDGVAGMAVKEPVRWDALLLLMLLDGLAGGESRFRAMSFILFEGVVISTECNIMRGTDAFGVVRRGGVIGRGVDFCGDKRSSSSASDPSALDPRP